MASFDSLVFDQALRPLLGDLEQLYEEMDLEYARVAARYGFECTGCTDNCCLSRFYHYTYIECIYLRRGFVQLSQQKRAQVRKRAEKYVEALEQRDSQGEDFPFRMMCPLNESGLCIFYPRRPMICRLHGLPHELAPPGGPKTVFGPGCHEFAEKCGHLPYYPFDRTRFYMRMSELEAGARKILGASEKPKKTVAHMLICDEAERL